MNHISENPGRATSEADFSNVLETLRGLLLKRSTVCILGGAVLAAACATLNLSSDTTIQAAQLGNEPSGQSGMLIVPRGADTRTGMVPAWRSLSSGSETSATTNNPTRAVPTNSVPTNSFRPSSQGRAALLRPSIPSNDASQVTENTPPQVIPSENRLSGSRGMIRPAGGGTLRSRGQVQQDGTLLIPPDVPTTEMVTPPPYRPAQPLFPNDGAPPVLPDNLPRAVYPDGSDIHSPPPAMPAPGAPDPYAPYTLAPNSTAPYSATPNASDRFDNDVNVEPPPHEHSIQQPNAHIIAPAPTLNRPQAYFAPGASGFRATVECDAPPWMDPYYGRTAQMPVGHEGSPTPAPSVQLPSDFISWWDPLVRQSAGLAPQTLPVEVATLVQQALANAPQVQVLQADPEVQYTVVRQEEAAFDWRSFLDAKYSDLSDPVGNTLTLGPGGGNRFIKQ